MTKPKAPITSIVNMIFSASAVAEFFGVAPRTIRHWVSEGMPKIGHGKFNLMECFAWWNENMNNSSSATEEKARERYWIAKARREEHQVKVLEDSVLDKEKLETEWCKRVQELVKGLDSQASVFPPLCAKKDEKTIKKIIEEYNYKLRSNYARYGKFTPVVTKTTGKKKKK
jgi:phage terminase Nu1 subunit (DNA packaging protein)